MPSRLHGILLMIAAMACFAAMNTGIRWLVPHLATTQIVFLRNVASLILMLVWIGIAGRGRGLFRTQRLSSHFWRAGIGFIAMEPWFYALSLMPLTLATALSFTTPLFSTIFAVWILKEAAGWRRLSAVGIGFFGVLIILRPDTQSLNADAGIVLASSALMALAAILVKSLTRTEAPETIVFFMALFMTPLSFPLALMHWQSFTFTQGIVIFLVAVFSTASHVMMARAYRHADMVVLMPFDFLRLLFTGLLAYIFFQEKADGWTVAGALVIVASSVYIAHREAVRKLHITQPSAEA